jgi:hypothetical protein
VDPVGVDGIDQGDRLADKLVGQGIEKLTVDYWRIWYYPLRAAGWSRAARNERALESLQRRGR